MRRRSTALIVAGCLLPLGCSGDGPDGPTADDFREGACRTLAPAVLTVGRVARELGDGPSLPADRVQELTDAQAALRDPAVDSAQISAPLVQLVADIGFVRIRAASNTYDPEAGAALVRSYDTVVATCTATGSATPTG